MKIERISHGQAVLVLDQNELDLIANSLNEVCHALEEWEFATRVGAQRPEAVKLLHYVTQASDRLRAARGGDEPDTR